MDRVAIELKNVSTAYRGERRPSLQDVNLKVYAGEYVLISGPNGAGKTTLLETLLWILKPCRGTVELLGCKLPRGLEAVRTKCSYVPQDFMRPSNDPFRVKDVVAMGLASNKPLGKLSEEDWSKVEEALKLTGLSELANKPIGKLSGGQQQKVFISRALVRDPEIILMDEPFSCLDTTSRRHVESLLKDAVSMGKTALLVSHVTTVLRGFSKEVKLFEGRVVEVVEC